MQEYLRRMRRKLGVFRTGKASHSARTKATISGALLNLSTYFGFLPQNSTDFETG